MGGVFSSKAPPPAPVAKPVVEKKESPAERQEALGRAESEIQGQLAARRGRRGRASTVLGAADETAGGMTVAKRLLGE